MTNEIIIQGTRLKVRLIIIIYFRFDDYLYDYITLHDCWYHYHFSAVTNNTQTTSLPTSPSSALVTNSTVATKPTKWTAHPLPSAPTTTAKQG